MNTTDSNGSDPSCKNLDWAQFEAITCGFRPEFILVYQEFEKELPKLLEELRVAIQSVSYQRVADLAHQIKGTAANFGFIGVSNAMHQLEAEIQKQSIQDAHSHFIATETAFRQAQREVGARLPK